MLEQACQHTKCNYAERECNLGRTAHNQVIPAGTQNGGLLGAGMTIAPAAAPSSSSVSTAQGMPSEPALALRSSGARKWGPAQFAPAAQSASQPASSAAPAAGEALSPSYTLQVHCSPLCGMRSALLLVYMLLVSVM